MSVRSMLSALGCMLLVVAPAALGGGCGGGNDDAVEIHVVLKQDDSVSMTPLEVSSGRVTFLVENEMAEERVFGIVKFSIGATVDREGIESVIVPADGSERISVDLEGGNYGGCSQPAHGSPGQAVEARCLTFTVR